MRLAPSAPDAYATLSELHGARGDARRSLDFALIAAHLAPKDAKDERGTAAMVARWRGLAERCHALHDLRGATYCLFRVLKADPTDANARWDRAMLFTELGELKSAATCLSVLRTDRPHDPDVARMAARIAFRLGHPEEAVSQLEAFLGSNGPQLDATLVNVLAELYIALGRHAPALALLKAAAAGRPPHEANAPLPLDLSVKAGICHAWLGDAPAADNALAPLLSAGVADFGDLFAAAGDAFWALGDARRAAAFLEPLRALPSYDTPELWARLATCCEAADPGGDSALRFYASVLAGRERDDAAACAALGELLLARNRTDEAMAWLARAEEAAAREAGEAAAGGSGGGGGAAAGGADGVAGGGGASGPRHAAVDQGATLRRLRAAQLRSDAAGDPSLFVAVAAPLLASSLAAELAATDPARPAREDGYKRKYHRRAVAALQHARGVCDAPTPPVPDVLHSDASFALLESCVASMIAAGDGAGARALLRSATQLATRLGSARRRLLSLRRMAAQAAAVAGDHGGAAAALRLVLSYASPDARGGGPAAWTAFAAAALGAASEAVDGVAARGKGGVGDAAHALQLRAKMLARLGSRHPANAGLWATQAAVLAAPPQPGDAFGGAGQTQGEGGAAADTSRLSRPPPPPPRPAVFAPCAAAEASLAAAAARELAPGGVPATAAPLAPLWRALSLSPRSPLVCLTAACAVAEHGASGHTQHRGGAVVAAFALLERYAALRRRPGEAGYNAARLAHGLGLAHLAVPLYEGVLEGGGGTPLAREAAHNLASIYAASGAKGLARQLLRRFATV